MDREPAELSRERAVSSEPCSTTRPNPFDDSEHSSRKRQRLSRSGSRSRSADTARASITTPDSMSLPDEGTNSEAHSAPPRTPTRSGSHPPSEPPTSSRVTINLRTIRPLESIPSSPPSPITPSKMADGGVDTSLRVSVESESDALSTAPAIETPSSSPSAVGSPKIEIVAMSEDDDEFASRDPPLAIIDEDEVFIDPMQNIPYQNDGDTPVSVVRKVAAFWQYEDMDYDEGESFCKLRDWIESYLAFTQDRPDTWYESFSRYRQFWVILPDIVWALSYRNKFFAPSVERGREGHDALSGFFRQFARLVGRFVAMDAKTVSDHPQKNDNTQEPDLASRFYVISYDYLLRHEEGSSNPHIGKNLETHYHWNWDEEVALMTSGFHGAGGSISALAKLIEGFGMQASMPYPKTIEILTALCRFAFRGVHDSCLVLNQPNRHPRQLVEFCRSQVIYGYDFFKAMSAALDYIIEKQVTCLTPDSACQIIRIEGNILLNTLIQENGGARELLSSKRGEFPDMHPGELPTLIMNDWKFNMFKKLIMSTQMQLRVSSVVNMSTELKNMYQNANKIGEASQSPLLLYFADFILRNKLVEYLVGIASHPEIIVESDAVLGFLIVTKTYKSSQVNSIWQIVTTSQDPRVVEAILKMLKKCLNLHTYAELMFLCRKVKSLPIEAFTMVMRDFCQELCRYLVDKARHEGVQRIDSPPYDMCVRLVRESSVITPESPAGHPEIQTFATIQLRDLLPYGPSDHSRQEIYLECILDVSARAPTSPGSICVINALLRSNHFADLSTMTTEHGLTGLVIQELESTIAEDQHYSNPSIRLSPASLAHRELLLAIIVQEPDTISPELGTKLWNLLVGNASKNVIDRDMWWQMLNNALTKSATDNSFIAACFNDYFPTLSPACFTTGALEFARKAITSWLKDAAQTVGETLVFESPALEQLWRMILKAPPNTIDEAAILSLVGVYVDSALILSLPRAKARIIHSALVDRCLQQLATAARNLKSYDQDATTHNADEAMVLVPSEAEFQEQELVFARSLAVLREFLRLYHLKPQFATPKSISPLTSSTTGMEGELLTVKYQCFDGDKHTEIESLTLGKLNPAASLFTGIQKATGFKKFKLFCGGKGLDPDDVEVCRSLEDLNLNGLVLVQRRDGDDGPAPSSVMKTSLEGEITKHFDDLWGYLGMHEKVAQEIYHFLVKFPVYDRLLKDFDSEEISYSQIFPQSQPLKSLYAVHALREYIMVKSQKGSVDERALTRAIALIVSTLSDKALLDQCLHEELRGNLALHLLDSFVVFLREPMLPDSVASLLSETLLERLLQLLHDALSVATYQIAIHLVCRSFEAILEASLHNPDFWSAFKSRLNSNMLLKELLLENSTAVVRKNVTKQIMTKCTFSPSLARVSTTEFAVAFWPLVATLIPLTVRHPHNCEETFQLSLALFKKLAETSLEILSLETLVKQWAALLLAHSSREIVGTLESVDMITQGLANLCYTAASFAKASQQSLSCSTIGVELFKKHLFPDISLYDNHDARIVIAPKIPLLNTVTRHIISETIFHLVKDDEVEYRRILHLLHSLVPYENSDEGPYVYEMPWMFDRSKSIRSSTGYVGLRNLSNTCYLNSLFTQLFMNVPFREFMLNAHVAEGVSSQKLLSETQNLFSNMQNSLRRFVDPANLAASIRTYDDANIDVNVQMDVDEFYNLLFDRWESQILSNEAKTQFRSFYGGQLVQQVKSKECAHVSERLEPFSAIQCDIKGKSCLQESLQAYVDGEIMEGDNKYKCSTCDRHVDAVKRACLQDIPDNLIFHLKRFEFNLRTLQRSKINDHFSFPEKIDMRPYKVEHLMDNPEQSPEDVFELVGILVHSGTAESGHYYSYIRERPSKSEKENWVEFNDDTVTPWDIKSMENSCFGGIDYRSPMDNSNMHFDKTWSAYMLFYQRSSVLATQKQALEQSEMSSPIRLPIVPRLSNHIALENELVMRKYCLYDPSHGAFVLKMLANIKQINKGRCSESHNLEKLALVMALNHLDQVVSRTKDLPDFPSFMISLKQICQSCAECSVDFLEWFCQRPEALRNTLLRNPDMLVRSEMATFIINSLLKVKADANYAYGLTDEEDSVDALDTNDDPRVLQDVVATISKLLDIFHNNTRAWPEFFGVLSNIAGLGDQEAALLVDKGYLQKSLEIICADPMLRITNQLQRMLNIISKRIATRPVSFDSIIGLLDRLLDVCDLDLRPIAAGQERFVRERLDSSSSDERVRITQDENHLLLQHWTSNQAHILTEKLLQIHQNYHATHAIIKKLLQSSRSPDSCIYNAISHGIRRGSSAAPSGPFLRAAIVYCEYSQEAKAIPSMVSCVAKMANHIDAAEGKELLQFFLDVIELKTDHNKEDLIKLCLDNIALWAPVLLNNYDIVVRENTEAFLVDILLQYGCPPSFGTSPEDVEKANEMVVVGQKLGIACLEYLNDTYIKARQQAVRVSLDSILNIIANCRSYFEEDADDGITRHFNEMHSSVIFGLKKFTVEEVDEEVSDWDGSEGEYGSSEPMDSIAELGGAVHDELDTDPQL